ncbi:MAG: hypothetical protein OQL09_09025, partial [Gammaproteobacteria bacterium]|nr:hypothetical protein [Gammaproteobacteria bacterium]
MISIGAACLRIGRLPSLASICFLNPNLVVGSFYTLLLANTLPYWHYKHKIPHTQETRMSEVIAQQWLENAASTATNKDHAA